MHDSRLRQVESTLSEPPYHRHPPTNNSSTISFLPLHVEECSGKPYPALQCSPGISGLYAATGGLGKLEQCHPFSFLSGGFTFRLGPPENWNGTFVCEVWKKNKNPQFGRDATVLMRNTRGRIVQWCYQLKSDPLLNIDSQSIMPLATCRLEKDRQSHHLILVRNIPISAYDWVPKPWSCRGALTQISAINLVYSFYWARSLRALPIDR
jgi:hypothetical protein